MATIHHQVLINAPVEKVYQVISTADGIGTWWDKQARTETDSGPVLEHNPGPEHGVVKLRVVELVPNKRVASVPIRRAALLLPGRVLTSFSRSSRAITSLRLVRTAIRSRPPSWIFPKWVMMNRVNSLDPTTPLGSKYCKI